MDNSEVPKSKETELPDPFQFSTWQEDLLLQLEDASQAHAAPSTKRLATRGSGRG